MNLATNERQRMKLPTINSTSYAYRNSPFQGIYRELGRVFGRIDALQTTERERKKFAPSYASRSTVADATELEDLWEAYGHDASLLSWGTSATEKKFDTVGAVDASTLGLKPGEHPGGKLAGRYLLLFNREKTTSLVLRFTGEVRTSQGELAGWEFEAERDGKRIGVAVFND